VLLSWETAAMTGARKSSVGVSPDVVVVHQIKGNAYKCVEVSLVIASKGVTKNKKKIRNFSLY